ncbi:thioredoxin-like domain-containing protein [uncultured Prevotella sp.]|uniref:thioredoxin-like domain-containing protein n=1 Tax=uncultured Prevotella sp. TaxID=159272 RepID=UPI00263A242B|nr:thioredoxin-like domain-containing protein [uncultured Prevotella sp.]
MKKTISSLMTLLVAALVITSCGRGKFHVKGNITKAKDSVLYFENMSLDGPVAIDSVKLSESGEFSFSDDAPGAPEFYRLRIANQIINLSVDSTETITVKADYPRMSTGYTVEGSEQCNVIKDLALKQINLQAFVMGIENNPAIGYDAVEDTIVKTIEKYKEYIKLNYIYKQPMKASSYFALFQTIGNRLIFNPRQSKEDIKAFAAVATSWDTYYPNSLRGKNLHNIAIEGMKNVRILENKLAASQRGIDPSKVNVSNIIEIALADNHGNQRRLTDMKGRVVLLDFHVFGAEGSTQRIMKLREIYNKYHSKGLEIFQVSFDPDEHFWKTQTAALPWICVHDDAAMNSNLITLYNIQQLPTFFLVDKNNVLYKRDAQIKNLDAEIQSLL